MLDMSGRVSTGREQGLLGLAFHPKWPNDPRIFINYTDRSGVTRIEAWMLRTPMTRAVPSSVVTELEQPFANHNGGWLAFGPDSLLYVGTGDGGGAGDPDDRAQASDDRLGKMLRYDVGEGPRGVASPAGGSSDDADPAVWGIGLRNPWRYSFDEASGALWIGDVGQDKREEINVVPRSKFDEVVNFGWRQREGDSPFRSDGVQGSGVTIPPVIDYTRLRGCSVTGGAVYRGKAIKDLVGMYLFADVCEAGIRVVDADTAVRRSRPLRVWSTIAGGAQIVSINVGHSGEVLVVGHGGEIWQIVPRTEP
jgi:glucose/arabinose dehydrogenase